MKGHPEILATLNTLLTAELTSIDVYRGQSLALEDMGYTRLYERLHHEVDDETGHAEALIKRILFFEGQPNMLARLDAKLGETPAQMLRIGLELEYDVARNLNAAITLCIEHKDAGSREILEALLVDTEEDHILWLETQLELIEQLGEENYLAEQMS